MVPNSPVRKGSFVGKNAVLMPCYVNIGAYIDEGTMIDTFAEGIIAAAKDLSISVPLVVRLEGTNVDKGKEILDNSGIDIISASDLDDAAKKIVELV